MLRKLRRTFPPEYCIELSVESPNAHLAEVPVRVDDLSPLHLPLALPGEVEAAALHLLPADWRVGQQEAAGHLVWRHLLSTLQGSQVGRLQVLTMKRGSLNEWDNRGDNISG